MKGTAMYVSDLIELLEGMDPDAEVRLAIQPRYPFEHHIDSVEESDGVVYVSEGGHRGYLPGEAREALGW